MHSPTGAYRTFSPFWLSKRSHTIPGRPPPGRATPSSSSPWSRGHGELVGAAGRRTTRRGCGAPEPRSQSLMWHARNHPGKTRSAASAQPWVRLPASWPGMRRGQRERPHRGAAAPIDRGRWNRSGSPSGSRRRRPRRPRGGRSPPAHSRPMKRGAPRSRRRGGRARGPSWSGLDAAAATPRPHDPCRFVNQISTMWRIATLRRSSVQENDFSNSGNSST